MSKEEIHYPPLNSFFDTIISLLGENDIIAIYDADGKYIFKGTIDTLPEKKILKNIGGIETNGERIIRFGPGNSHGFVDRKEITHYIDKLVERKIAIISLKTKKDIYAVMNISNEDFSNFSVKNGETDVEAYWYEFRNVAAKKLKEKGIFEWGSHRLYFDIGFDDFETLKSLMIDISSDKKIPIAFKYLDREKSHKSDTSIESKTTHFVANFKDINDAKKFYKILSERAEYRKLKPDKKREYDGYTVDELCTYANKYREQRAALWQMIKTASFNNDNTVEYIRLNGKPVKITADEYHAFKKQFSDMEEAIKEWEKY